MAPETIPVDRRKVLYKGTFQIDGVLKLIQEYLKTNQFSVKEKKYEQGPGQLANSLNIKAEYEATRRDSVYFKHAVAIEVMAQDLEEAEVIKDGKKRIVDNGRLTITLSGTVEMDPDKRFEKTPHLTKLRLALKNFIMKNEIGQKQVGPVDDMLFDLKKKIEEFLAMDVSTKK